MFKIGDTVIALDSYHKQVTEGHRYIVTNLVRQPAGYSLYFINNFGEKCTWDYTHFKLCEATMDFNDTLEEILK